jgi:hypothetical protein
MEKTEDGFLEIGVRGMGERTSTIVDIAGLIAIKTAVEAALLCESSRFEHEVREWEIRGELLDVPYVVYPKGLVVFVGEENQLVLDVENLHLWQAALNIAMRYGLFKKASYQRFRHSDQPSWEFVITKGDEDDVSLALLVDEAEIGLGFVHDVSFFSGLANLIAVLYTGKDVEPDEEPAYTDGDDEEEGATA